MPAWFLVQRKGLRPLFSPISYRASIDPGKVSICHCTDCGAPVYATAFGDNPTYYSLRVGALEQRASLPPRRQIWCKSAVPWSANIKDVPGRSGFCASDGFRPEAEIHGRH